MLHLEFSAKEIKLADFLKAEVNVKSKIIDILNQFESIWGMFNDEAEDTLDFKLIIVISRTLTFV